MTELTPIECEARLMGFKKESRADGEWTSLTFQIHPDDTPHALFLLPLKTHVMLAISGAAEPTGEQTADEPAQTPAEPDRPKGGPICKRAVMLCKNATFQIWYQARAWRLWQENCSATEADVTDVLRENCCIQSRSELDHNPEAAAIFEAIERDFYASQRGDTDEARIAQRDRV